MASGALPATPARLALGRGTDLILPIGFIASVLVIMVPVPAPVLDVLLALNITVAVLMLLTTINVKNPLEFNVFPSLLLATTLGRLVLNVATTRLILTKADRQGLSAAGDVVRSFGEFVAGDRMVVGLIIFIIIVVIQFVVITKGATRISEVAARFALDGMPGRQMAIDADLNAGVIDEKEAQRRRLEITQQADFFGSMDGASKFVRGDAIAGIIITVVNIVGGLFIGVIQGGMPLARAAEVYTKLTIGDGLVSQVPAFLISLAAGLLTTRSSTDTNLPQEFIGQLLSRPQALFVTGGFLGLLVFTSLPTIPLLTIGGSCVALALTLNRQDKDSRTKVAKASAEAQQKKPDERIEDLLQVDPMEIELSVSLVKLADPRRGGDLLERVHGVRQMVASDVGIILPKVRLRDNMRLEQNTYRVKIAGVAVAQGTIYPQMQLAMDSGVTTGKVTGIDVREPAFDRPATWIEPAERERAEMLGYTVVEPSAVIATHLSAVVRKHADEILTRDATKHLLDELKKTSPAVVDELVPGVLKLAELQQVLQLLLNEQVPIRQLAPILETLGDYAARTKDPVLLGEFVRHRLGRTICGRYRDTNGTMRVVTLDPAVEDRIRAGAELTERGIVVRMSPQAIDVTCRAIAAELEKLKRGNHPPIVLVSPQTRPLLKRLTQSHLPQLVVLSFNEITRDTQIEAVGMVSDAK